MVSGLCVSWYTASFRSRRENDGNLALSKISFSASAARDVDAAALCSTRGSAIGNLGEVTDDQIKLFDNRENKRSSSIYLVINLTSHISKLFAEHPTVPIRYDAHQVAD